jgi:hypothetical protein
MKYKPVVNTPLAKAGGVFTVVPLVTAFDLPGGGQGLEECFNCVPFRPVASGNATIPEPTTPALTGMGISGLVLARKRKG